MAHVAELHSFPVKGCASTRTDVTELAEAGLRGDRSFLVTGADGTFRSQRRDPRLALIVPELSPDGATLTLRAPGAGEVTVEVDTAGPRKAITLFGNGYQGIDQGGPVADWLSGVLDAPSRLVRVPPEHSRVSDGAVSGAVGYADSGALTMLSTASMRELNSRLKKAGSPELGLDRFRTNVVVDGWDEPHIEDRALRVEAGGTEWAWAKLATRCVVTTVDQERGVKSGPEPLRTLAGYRRAESGAVFAVKYAVLRPGRLAVGDEIRVTRWGGAGS